LDRAGAVLLLKEIMHECESFIEAQAVSISETESGYILKAKWICPQFERDCLRRIMLKHNVEISELDDYTVFC
jgi:hypothetical protein